jgi:ABC-type glycerol-3-phosphate transport system substrate-binding protein
MNNFQTVLTVIFISAFVFGVLIFSGLIKVGGSSTTVGLQGNVVIWGTFPKSAIGAQLESLSMANKNLKVTYFKKDIATYQQDLIESFANAKGPDLFIITADMIQKNSNFIYKIPYASYPQKTFNDSFIDGADVYLDNEGVIALPLVIDPIVLYYNKDMLLNENIVNPPQTWDELFTMNSMLTKRDNVGSISQSMIALGQYENVTNAKNILATLLLQNGNKIVSSDGVSYSSLLNESKKGGVGSPLIEAVNFFTQFSNNLNTAYSWNRSMSDSIDMFTSSKLAFYIGKASELFKIQSVNPNLSFNVTGIPQIKNTKSKTTDADIYAIAISKKTTNMISAFSIAGSLVASDSAKIFSAGASLPPASRVLLSDKPVDNAYMDTFYRSALVSRSWADPDKAKSDLVFKEMIENTLSNAMSVDEAAMKAHSQLDQLMNK